MKGNKQKRGKRSRAGAEMKRWGCETVWERKCVCVCVTERERECVWERGSGAGLSHKTKEVQVTPSLPPSLTHSLSFLCHCLYFCPFSFFYLLPSLLLCLSLLPSRLLLLCLQSFFFFIAFFILLSEMYTIQTKAHERPCPHSYMCFWSLSWF